jgi:hypothetical protein
MIEVRYLLWWCWHKKTEPAPVITSTFAHAAWHLSHSTCRISLAGLYAFAATPPRWPPAKIPIASPFLVNAASALAAPFPIPLLETVTVKAVPALLRSARAIAGAWTRAIALAYATTAAIVLPLPAAVG